jgi:hypothetical protein
MRSGWLQRSSRIVAALLLLATMWQMPHRWQDDDACAPVAESHDESKHVYTTPEAGPHAEHCAVCHWTRLLKPVFGSTAEATTASGGRSDLLPFAAETVRDPASDRLPPRAPPAV